jgi:hypothetical protein
MAIWRNRQSSGPTSFWKQQGWIVSAFFMAGVIVFGAVMFLFANSSDLTTTVVSPVVAGPLSADAPRGAAGRPTGCETDDSKTEMPKQAPIDVRWETVATRRLPISVSAGPTEADKGMLWCFARTPLGAAMAAQVITTTIRSEAWNTVLDQQLVAGQARDFYQSVYARPAEKAGETLQNYLGFAVTDFTPDIATVRLLTGSEGQTNVMNTSLFWTDVTVAWVDGDWKIVVSSGGTLTGAWNSVSSSAGFVTWGG